MSPRERLICTYCGRRIDSSPTYPYALVHVDTNEARCSLYAQIR